MFLLQRRTERICWNVRANANLNKNLMGRRRMIFLSDDDDEEEEDLSDESNI